MRETRVGNKKIVVLLICILLSQFLYVFFAHQARAANFTEASIRFSRMTISIAASSTNDILVVLKPATTGTEDSVGIKFASGYTVDSTPTNITLSTAGLPSTYHGESLTAMPGIGANALAVSGQNVTIDIDDLTVGTLYGFRITGGITNPSSTGQHINRLSTHTDTTPDFTNYTDAVDDSRVANYHVTDNGVDTDDDQIVVTARVAPTYTLDLSANSITLDASLSTVEYPGGPNNGSVSAITATVTTNANNGHIMWLRSATNAGLTSTSVSASIAFSGTPADATPTTLTAGTEGVVIDIDKTTDTSGTLTIAAEFNGTTTSAGGTPSTTYQEIAHASGPVAGAGDVVTFIPRVAISATTQAADDYTQTFTIVGAGDF
jgi:hypothetical protein